MASYPPRCIFFRVPFGHQSSPPRRLDGSFDRPLRVFPENGQISTNEDRPRWHSKHRNISRCFFLLLHCPLDIHNQTCYAIIKFFEKSRVSTK